MIFPKHHTPTARRSKKRGTKLSQAERMDAVLAAHRHLRKARDYLAKADCPNAAGKTRDALKSCEGALRHVELAPYREARQAKKRAGLPYGGMDSLGERG